MHFYFLCMGVCLHAYLCITCVWCPQRPEEALGSLKLVSQMIVSHVGPRNQAFARAKCPWLLGHLSRAPTSSLFGFLLWDRVSLDSQGWTQTHNPISSVRILQMCYLTRKGVFCFIFNFYNRIWNYSEEFYFIIAIRMEIQIILNISHVSLD